MYIEVVPNRDSKPCILLRESYRQDGKVCKRTLANLSKLPPQAIEGLRALLRGGTVIEGLSDSFEIIRSQPYGVSVRPTPSSRPGPDFGRSRQEVIHGAEADKEPI